MYVTALLSVKVLQRGFRVCMHDSVRERRHMCVARRPYDK